MNSINYNIPILLENFENNPNDDFIINGVAINATTTDNNHKFLPEELRISANTLKNRPLLTDHEDKIKAIAGRVINAEYDELSRAIKFKAKLNNSEQGKLARQLIKDGDLNTVSIGANVERFEEDLNVMIPRGIKFKELSLVATPADDNATFNLIHNDFVSKLEEVWKLQISHSSKANSNISDDKLNYRRLNMEKGEESIDVKSKIEESDKIEEVKKVEVRELDNVKKDMSNLQNSIYEISNQVKSQTEILSKVLSDFNKLQEIKVNEHKVQETELKEEVIEEDNIEEDLNKIDKSGYKIVQGYKSFTIERNKYK